jgi:predicted porin
MRKILLGTTGVVGVALLGMGAAQAQQAPTVRIGGYMQSTIYSVNDDLDKANGVPTGVLGLGTRSRAQTDFRNEIEVHVFVTGKAANGLAYGAVIEFQSDGTGGGSGSAVDLDEAYVFVSLPTLGTIRFGEVDSAAGLLQVRAPSIRGFGPDGPWGNGILQTPNGTSTGPSLLTSINGGSDATKIVYLSPQFAGFDFGLSYAPNTGEGERLFFGRSVDTLGAGGTPIGYAVTQRDRTSLENEFSAALRYRGTFGGFGISAGVGYMQADAPTTSVSSTFGTVGNLSTVTDQNIQAYTIGLNLSAFGLTVGGEYTWGKFGAGSVGRTALASGRDDTQLYVLGATYTAGALSIGAYYGIAEADNGGTLADREQTGVGIGAVYTLAPGLELFASYNQIDDKNPRLSLSALPATSGTTNPALGSRSAGTLVNRDISAFFVGTRLSF